MMNGRGKFGFTPLVWVGLVLIVVLVAVGIIFLDKIVPRKHFVTFSFAGWTNDAQGARILVLQISNRSQAPLQYMADQQSQPLCCCWVLTAQKAGNRELTVRSNFTGLKILQLQPRQVVNSLVPWRDDYTNGQFVFAYSRRPTTFQRAQEYIEGALTSQSTRNYMSVPLTGAPWTNSAPQSWR